MQYLGLCRRNSEEILRRQRWNNILPLCSTLELGFGERKPRPDVMRPLWRHILPARRIMMPDNQSEAHGKQRHHKLLFLFLIILHSSLPLSSFFTFLFPSFYSNPISSFLPIIHLPFPPSIILFSLFLFISLSISPSLHLHLLLYQFVDFCFCPSISYSLIFLYQLLFRFSLHFLPLAFPVIF